MTSNTNNIGGYNISVYHQHGADAHAGMSSSRKLEFECLYTTKKTQKRKVWHDGRLVVSGSTSCQRATLYPARIGASHLDECELLVRVGPNVQFEMPLALVQVEGPWKHQNPILAEETNTLVSNGMKKVISSKFRKPGQYVPPRDRSLRSNPLGSRKRPLQPGELYREHHGAAPMPQQNANAHQAGNVGQHFSQPAPPRGYQGQHGQPIQMAGTRRHTSGPSPTKICYQGTSHDIQAPRQSTSSVAQRGTPSPRHEASTNPPRNEGSVQPASFAPTQRNPAIEHPGSEPEVVSMASFVPRNQRNSNFAGNSFDPKSIYGDDEEEEQEDTMENRQTTDSYQAENQVLPPSNVARPEEQGPQQGDNPSKERSTLSRDQLLQLFGFDRSASNSETRKDIGDEHSNDQAVASQTATEMQNFVLPTPPSSDSESSDDEE